MAARPTPRRVQRCHRCRPAGCDVSLVRTLDAVLPTPLLLQLVHLPDLLADITAALAHFLGTLFQTQNIAGVCSLAE
jgi:hypothetical protein